MGVFFNSKARVVIRLRSWWVFSFLKVLEDTRAKSCFSSMSFSEVFFSSFQGDNICYHLNAYRRDFLQLLQFEFLDILLGA